MPDSEENVVRKVMPSNEKAERGILGALLSDSEHIAADRVMETITADDFYNPQNRELFRAMEELYNNNKGIDPVNIIEQCQAMGIAAEAYNFDYLSGLMEQSFGSANIENYCQIVKDRSTIRGLIKNCEAITEMSYKGDMDSKDLLEKAESQIFNFLQTRNQSGNDETISDVVQEALYSIQDSMLNKGRISGVPSGFTDLDDILTGFHGSELLLVGARPAMGKTAFVLNIAAHAAIAEKKCVAIFSLEMAKSELVKRVLSLESSVVSDKIRTGDLSDEEVEKLIDAGTRLSGTNMYIYDTPGIRVSDIRAKARRIIREQGHLDLIAIDYLQLMRADERVGSRQEEVASVSRNLKGLAKEFNVPVIALSQLNRAAASRDDHRPNMSDLRESGSIEQDADVIMFIHREEYYNPETPKQGIAEIIIAKQRNGATGTIDLAWIGKNTKFANLDKARKKMLEHD